jgi:hypothetical protein
MLSDFIDDGVPPPKLRAGDKNKVDAACSWLTGARVSYQSISLFQTPLHVKST